MRGGDVRSKKVAVVPHVLVNATSAQPALAQARQLLEESGVGVIAVPRPELVTDVAYWITTTLDQVLDYRKHGYWTFVVGVEGIPGFGIWYPRLAEEFRRRAGVDAVFIRLDPQDPEAGLRALDQVLNQAAHVEHA